MKILPIFLIFLTSESAIALTKVQTTNTFIGAVDTTPMTTVVLGVGAGLAAFACLWYAVTVALGLLTGKKVFIKGHGIYDRDVADRAANILDEFRASGGKLDKQSDSFVTTMKFKSHLDEYDVVESCERGESW